MDPRSFLKDALHYAHEHNIDFNGYTTQYDTLRSGVLPLFKDCSLVGVVTADHDGHLQYEQTWQTSRRACPPQQDGLRYFS